VFIFIYKLINITIIKYLTYKSNLAYKNIFVHFVDWILS
jgi:hypothetical protein